MKTAVQIWAGEGSRSCQWSEVGEEGGETAHGERSPCVSTSSTGLSFPQPQKEQMSFPRL